MNFPFVFIKVVIALTDGNKGYGIPGAIIIIEVILMTRLRSIWMLIIV